MRCLASTLIVICAANISVHAADFVAPTDGATYVASQRHQDVLAANRHALLVSGPPRVVSAKRIGIRPSTPIQHRLAILGSRTNWSLVVVAKPTWLSVDADGDLSGTAPSTTGTSTLTVTVTNDAAPTGVTLSWDIVVGSTLALTPPLGWNSYTAFVDGVTEGQMRAHAQLFADRLQPIGFDTMVVDYRWYDPDTTAGSYDYQGLNVIDGNGRFLPSVRKFPSANPTEYTRRGKTMTGVPYTASGGAARNPSEDYEAADDASFYAGRPSTGGEAAQFDYLRERSTGSLGFAPLAADIHAQGLKFGIHMMRGVSRLGSTGDVDNGFGSNQATAKACLLYTSDAADDM
jgi:hypothetical protein